MTKESLEPLSLLVWERSGFEISTTCVVWTQLNTTFLAELQKAQARSRRPMMHSSEEVGDPGKEELKTQLAQELLQNSTQLFSTPSPATDPCSLAPPHLSGHTSGAMQDRRWTEHRGLGEDTPGRLSEQGVRSRDKVQAPGLLWPLGKQPILHPTPLLPVQSEKVSRETQPSLGF